jgi:pSer/pThr/pTyr-binding forkhead associated (FHA) protein
MPNKVILTIIEGPLKGKFFEFDSRTTCIMGRHRECNPQLPNDKEHEQISRYHCFLDVNPPAIRIRDFGSCNGTYVNGKKIGQRLPHQTPEEGAKLVFPEYDLKPADKIKLGTTVFDVSVQAPPAASPTIKISPPQKNTPGLLKFLLNLLKLAQGGEHNLAAIRGYEIIRKLGEGGFGEVYLARHEETQQLVAIKMMLPEVIANEYVVKTFLREANNTKSLNHINVVHLIDYGYWDEVFFFTLEYCEGGTLEDLRQQQGGKLPLEEAIALILQVLDGLDYTHNAEIAVKTADGGFERGKGLVHRDIKPANIFLTHQGGQRIAKIADYGLSKAFDLAGLSGLSATGMKAGTPYFMPRQQMIDFKYAKPDVDIWATAATLYNLLTGCYPRDFDGKDPLYAILREAPIPIRNRDSRIPQPLAEVIDFALQDNPEIPFKSAAEFKKALTQVI